MPILTVTGEQLSPYLHDVARLRIAVFRDFPYLYDGSLDYELKYLEHYAQCPRSVFVLALDAQEQVVGVSTGLPMLDADEEFQRPFSQSPTPLSEIFYFGESVLLRDQRGQGFGHAFFDERERHALSLGATLTTFCAVDRPSDHPHRPQPYSPLDTFWQARGYTRQPALTTTFSWKDIDQAEETAKPMTFWTKPWP